MAKTVEELEGRRAAVLKEIEEIGDMRRGSVAERYRQCGKHPCCCEEANHPGHGPYYSLTVKAQGKTLTRHLAPAELSKVEREIAAFRRFQGKRGTGYFSIRTGALFAWWNTRSGNAACPPFPRRHHRARTDRLLRIVGRRPGAGAHGAGAHLQFSEASPIVTISAVAIPEGSGDMAIKSGRAKKRSEPEIVLRKGKPAAVILDIEHYRELVERAEDAEDLKMLEAMRRKPIRFRKLDDFLKSYSPDA